MKTILALTLSVAAALLAIPSAHAGGLAVSVNTGGYGYAGGYGGYSGGYRCAPTYYRAQPAVVYVQPRVYVPAPVYYRSAPVYYRPAPVCYRPSLSFTTGVSIGAGRHYWRR